MSKNIHSNNLSLKIDLKKINNNLSNKNFNKEINSVSSNNQKTINQMIKELQTKIKNNNIEQSLKIYSSEFSPNKINNNNKYFSKQISKENEPQKLSEINSSKIIHLKKPLKNDEFKLKNKINIKKELLNQKTDSLNPNLLTNINSSLNDNTLQYIKEYALEIIESLVIEENYFFNKIKYIDPFYLENENSQLNPEMRTIAVDWLVLIHHKIFKFQENTLFLSIQIFDRYLSKVNISKENAELLLISCFTLASKHNEKDYVNMQESLELCKNKFNKEQIIKMEYEILKIINFEILAPTTCEFFTVFANFLNFNNKKIYEGLYILNIILADFHMLEYPNFILALAVIKLIMKKIDKKLMLVIIKILKEKDMKTFYDKISINNNKILELCEKIKLLYNTFLETKYKNIQEKFSEDNNGSVSIYSSNLL